MGRITEQEENKKERIACRITSEQRTHLEELTKHHGFRSMSEVIQSLIEKSIKKH